MSGMKAHQNLITLYTDNTKLLRVEWGTPEFTPVEIGALPARATSVVETGNTPLKSWKDVF